MDLCCRRTGARGEANDRWPKRQVGVPWAFGAGRREADGLFTSEELFAELVDSPLPRPGRLRLPPGPIRVQVSDPARPLLAVPAETPIPSPSDTGTDVEDAFNRLGSEPSGRWCSGRRRRSSTTRKPGCRGGAPHERQATRHRSEDALGPGVDLASVAESAIQEKPAEPARPTPPPRPAPAREPSWRDDRFGPYQLIDRVAIGGMAEVFKAKRAGVEGFEKIVAVKRILPHLSENKEFLEMFVDEAKMVAGLAHPNIVQIFDLGRIEKSYYIAMEYVTGATCARSCAAPARRACACRSTCRCASRARCAPRSSTRTARRTTRAGRCRSSTATSARRTS